MTAQTLNLAQCKEYIKDLELSCYQQEKLLRKLPLQPAATKRQIAELEHKLQTERPPAEPSTAADTIGSTVIAFMGARIGALVGIAFRILLAIFSSSVKLFSSPWMPYILGGAAIGFGLGFLLVFPLSRADSKKRRETYSSDVEAFRRKQEDTRRLIEMKKAQLETVLPQKIKESEATYQTTKDLLKKYYDMGFIYPDYRGLVPICTIWGYLESGRCFSLLGHEGAICIHRNGPCT